MQTGLNTQGYFLKPKNRNNINTHQPAFGIKAIITKKIPNYSQNVENQIIDEMRNVKPIIKKGLMEAGLPVEDFNFLNLKHSLTGDVNTYRTARNRAKNNAIIKYQITYENGDNSKKVFYANRYANLNNLGKKIAEFMTGKKSG